MIREHPGDIAGSWYISGGSTHLSGTPPSLFRDLFRFLVPPHLEDPWEEHHRDCDERQSDSDENVSHPPVADPTRVLGANAHGGSIWDSARKGVKRELSSDFEMGDV